MGTYFRIPKVLRTIPSDRSKTYTQRKKESLPEGASISIKLLFAIEKAGEAFLDLLYPHADEFRHKRNYVKRKITVLQEQGLVTFDLQDNKRRLALTDKGERQLDMYKAKLEPPPKHWDGKWRFIIFDIWERRKRVRELLRMEIREYGFVKVQNSVWAYPYDCEEYIALLKTDLNIGRGLLFLVVEQVEDDHLLRSKFDL